MHDHDDGSTRSRPDDHAVIAVLRRGGEVEVPPPPHVWEAVRQALGQPGVVSLADRRRRRWAGPAQLLAAAAVGALVTWAGVGLADREVPPELVASGELGALAAGAPEGRAEVVSVDGHQRLRVELAERPDPGDGYLEVWLLRPDVSGMVTLGVLDGEAGEFPLPAGLDLEEYAVVDISREHMDGDPGHGGNSLVRGEVG